MEIKLKDIKPCPWNPRGEITPESVKELAESIDKIGLIHPITIWRAKYEGISAKLNSWKCKSEQMGEDEDLEAVITDAFQLTEDTEKTEALDYILDAVVCKVREWKDCEEWADTLRAFPSIAALAGVTDEERDALLARFDGKTDSDNNN